jgi:hypothetical protein
MKMSGPSHASAYRLAENEADILSLPLDQLLFGYVDEIFSDYSARKATLLEVRDEIKAIIEELISGRHRQRDQAHVTAATR